MTIVDYNNTRQVAVLHIARSYLIRNSKKNENERKDIGMVRQGVWKWNLDHVSPPISDQQFEEVWKFATEQYGC